MKLTLRVLAFAVSLLFAASYAFAQYTISQKQVSTSQTLAGHAVVGIDQVPAEGVTVELCSSDWKTTLDSAKTDKNGYFSLKTTKSKQVYYVRLSASGISPYQLRVRIKNRAAKELKIHLSNAT